MHMNLSLNFVDHLQEEEEQGTVVAAEGDMLSICTRIWQVLLCMPIYGLSCTFCSEILKSGETYLPNMEIIVASSTIFCTNWIYQSS